MAVKLWLLNRIRVYQELPSYWLSVKKSGWELLWGETFISIIFVGYTLIYSASVVTILLAAGTALVVAGYHAWRADHLRLIPKLEYWPGVFVQPGVAMTTNTAARYPVSYVQVLPRCSTDAPVEQCQGILLRVMRKSSNGWEPTRLNEPLDLIWSSRDSNPRTLYPHIDLRLNLLWVSMNGIELGVTPKQIKINDVFKIDEDYRFDIVVTGKDCPAIHTSVKVRFGANTVYRIANQTPLPVTAEICDDQQS